MMDAATKAKVLAAARRRSKMTVKDGVATGPDTGDRIEKSAAELGMRETHDPGIYMDKMPEALSGKARSKLRSLFAKKR